MAQTTVVHLLRHGEVDNPNGVLYGRLPGYHLSANGRLMAAAAADFFAERSVAALFASPLERAQETARPLARRLDLRVVTDERLIESGNVLEGRAVSLAGLALNPVNWRYLWNPFLPSWGEPYTHVAARMSAVIERARQAAPGGEAVCVSHQLPIWVSRLAAERRRLWHNPGTRQCALGSVTSLTFSGEELSGVSYAVPPRRQVRDPDAAQ
ncbi:histidine phosphatase family protein [Trebonia sp.]|uniref:histidine phosphatase family protein n=1 Tax=Trebonia sp. TaxID=2767075 RepID=UPI0026326CAA|nr:histidine phosphatase family protein [Trebonia sp.]